MTVVTWPSVGISTDNLHPRGKSLSPGPGLDGVEQIVTTENRIWQGEITLAPLVGDDVALWDAFLDQLDGRRGVFDLPVPNLFKIDAGASDAEFQASIGLTAAQIAAGRTGFSDSSQFSDGTGFALPTYSEPTARDAAAVGATSVYITGSTSSIIKVGSKFSVNNFLYRVSANASGMLSFTPPLREAIPAGTALSMTAPTIRLRLQEDDGGRVPHLPGNVKTGVSISVVEVLAR